MIWSSLSSLLALLQLVAGPDAPPDARFDPPWANIRPQRAIFLNPDPRLLPQENGERLADAIAALRPGDLLQIGAGTYSVRSYLNVAARGTSDAPVWIAARPGERVLITRPDASQNVLNVGGRGSAPVRFLALQGLEISGGSQGIHLESCSQVWIDRCTIHHTGEAGLTANSADTSLLWITRNEIHHTEGTGEGMYLGANWGARVMSRSTIALNHVHDTGGSQGDGIEIKQGSWGNRIVANLVHDTPYPAIIAYGTAGRPINLIERNLCWGSGDNVLQVQGEALVRNNLLMAGAIGFHSHDHQGRTRDLQFVHNTIVTEGPATDLTSWGGRPGMVFANNAVVSLKGASLVFTAGSKGVTLAGNVVSGPVVGATSGFTPGKGLADFLAVDAGGRARDARPSSGSSLRGAADPAWAVEEDLGGERRAGPLDAGCNDAR